MRQRLRWLEQRPRSFEKLNQPEPFLPQPYMHLAKVLREQGEEQAARDVEARRLRIEGWRRFKAEPTAVIFLPFWMLFRVFFRYGLSPLRAIGTFVICIGLGTWGVRVAQQERMLVQNTATTAPSLRRSPKGPEAVIPYAEEPGETTLLCGSAINDFVYATDVFIPLLNLHQEERCDVRSGFEEMGRMTPAVRTGAPTKLSGRLVAGWKALVGSPLTWQRAKFAYAVLGRIISSLMLLTVSGVLRKWESH